MPRPRRTDFPGAWHHAMNRGAGRADIFRDTTDFVFFAECMASAALRSDMEVHGYCFMTNHFHILLRSREGKLSDFLRSLTGRYVYEFNRRWRLDGALFRGRTKTVPVDSDAQLVMTSRYIHLNPVVAGLTQSSVDWPWSSASAFCGMMAPPSWLVTSEILAMFDGDSPGIRYSDFLAQGVDERTAHFYGELRME